MVMMKKEAKKSMIGEKETNEDNIQKINQDNIFDIHNYNNDYNANSTYIVV